MEKLSSPDQLRRDRKIGLAIPTNVFQEFKECILNNLEHFEDMRENSIFLVVFQHPVTPDEVVMADRIMTQAGWRFRFQLDPAWPQPLQILRLRNNCARLDQTCDAYFSMDSDMRFQPGTDSVDKPSGLRSLEAVDYMARNPRCGVVECRGFLGGSQWGQKVKPVWDWTYSCGAGGILLRNGNSMFGEPLVPPTSLHVAGGCDEPLMCLSRIEKGYFHALLRNHTTYHAPGNTIADGRGKDDWLDKDVCEKGPVAWIRERYNAKWWKHEASCKKNPVPYQGYLEAGGVDFRNNKGVIDDLTADYDYSGNKIERVRL